MSRIHWLHLVLVALVVAAMPAANPAAAKDRPSGPPRASGELIVRLAAWADPQRFAATEGLALRRDGQHKIPGEPIYRFQIADGSTPERKAAALAGRAGVVYAEPNYLARCPRPRSARRGSSASTRATTRPSGPPSASASARPTG